MLPCPPGPTQNWGGISPDASSLPTTIWFLTNPVSEPRHALLMSRYNPFSMGRKTFPKHKADHVPPLLSPKEHNLSPQIWQTRQALYHLVSRQLSASSVNPPSIPWDLSIFNCVSIMNTHYHCHAFSCTVSAQFWRPLLCEVSPPRLH